MKTYNPHKVFNSFYTPKAITRNPHISGDAKVLFSVLVTYCNSEGKCYPSKKRLEYECGLSEWKLRKALKELKTEGFIVALKNKMRSNAYMFLWHDSFDEYMNEQELEFTKSKVEEFERENMSSHEEKISLSKEEEVINNISNFNYNKSYINNTYIINNKLSYYLCMRAHLIRQVENSEIKLARPRKKNPVIPNLEGLEKYCIEEKVKQFMDYCRKNKKPLTQTRLDKNIDVLREGLEYNINPHVLLDKTLEKGWFGIYMNDFDKTKYKTSFLAPRSPKDEFSALRQARPAIAMKLDAMMKRGM